MLVRQQTLMLLTNLIKEQFLKWEGSVRFFLYFYFILYEERITFMKKVTEIFRLYIVLSLLFWIHINKFETMLDFVWLVLLTIVILKFIILNLG